MERQYEVAEAIYQELIPRSLEYFVGVVGGMDL